MRGSGGTENDKNRANQKRADFCAYIATKNADSAYPMPQKLHPYIHNLIQEVLHELEIMGLEEAWKVIQSGDNF